MTESTTTTTTTQLSVSDLTNISAALWMMASRQELKDAEDTESWLELQAKVRSILMESWQ